MPLSYRNILNTNQITEAINSGKWDSVLKKGSTNSAKYIQGYAEDTAVEALANSLNINKGLFRQIFGMETKEIDSYDPHNLANAKGEEFWLDSDSDNINGKAVQLRYDEDTNAFKRALRSKPGVKGYGESDFYYEDPFIPKFELYFDETSPLFNGSSPSLLNGNTASPNSLYDFMKKYVEVDSAYEERFNLWVEFKNVFFKIFEKELKINNETISRNKLNKAYYINSIKGLENLNKKMIKFGEDKMTITINEDVSMFAWYLAELYNNIVYSYKNQRFMFPENSMRFKMTVVVNELRNFQIPQSNNVSSPTVPVNDDSTTTKTIKNVISEKSQLTYTLHDCTFDFFSSRNHNDEMVIGGYGKSIDNTPQTLSFDIYYKSVTRESTFPLSNGLPINAWGDELYKASDQQEYFDNLSTIKQDDVPEKKGYLNKLLSKAAQTVSNQGFNYLDNLETKLREVRGSAVNGLLEQFREKTNLNKIEPDNIYNKEFNNRISLENLGKQVGGGLLNDLEDTVRDASNF